MSGFEFCVYEDQFPKDWDDFVIPHSYGSVHQISAWRDLQIHIPGREKVLGFAVRDSKTKKILSNTLCVQMMTGIGTTFWWYSPRGPVFDPERSIEAGRHLIQRVHDYLDRTDGIFWRWDPYFSVLQYQKLNISSLQSTQDYQPTDTLEIDLFLPDEAILSAMKRKGRYNISLAQKKDLRLVVKENGTFEEKDLEDFWNLNQATTSRDGFSGHSKEYYRHFLTFLKDYAVLFFIEMSDGTRIATAISTFCGTKAIYYFGASTSHSEHRTLMAPYLLQWEMIQYAKKKHCHTYDFLGIAPEGQLNHPYMGISEFKWKFGGQRKTYAHGREIVLKPFWYWLYSGSKTFKKLIQSSKKH